MFADDVELLGNLFQTDIDELDKFLDKERLKSPRNKNYDPNRTTSIVSPQLPIAANPVPADDAKRLYPKIFESVANVHDVNKMTKALRDICTPSFVGIFAYPRGNPHGVAYRELYGVDVFSDYFSASMSGAPDSIFFLHDTQIVGYEDGSSMIICKLTANGSRLHTVTAEMNGYPMPNPHTIEELHDSLEKSKASETLREDDSEQQQLPTEEQSLFYNDQNTPSSRSDIPSIVSGSEDVSGERDDDEEEEGSSSSDGLNSVGLPLVFKAKNSKFDRYKKLRVNTVGAHVTHRDFSETSLRVKNPSSSKVYAPQIKNEDDAAPVAKKQRAEVTRESFKAEEVVVSGSETKFGLSHMLPEPVLWSVHGVQKFYVNSQNQIYKIHFLLAFK